MLSGGPRASRRAAAEAKIWRMSPPTSIDNFSAVRQALGQLVQSAAELGYTPAIIGTRPRGRSWLSFSSRTPRATSIESTPS